MAEEIKELDFSVSSGTKAVEDIERNVEQFGNLHSDLDGGRVELEEVGWDFNNSVGVGSSGFFEDTSAKI